MRTALLLLAATFAGCANSTVAGTGATAPAPSVDLPASTLPSDAIAPLSFLEGRWVAVNPNGTVNEELWSVPRGKIAIGLFRQVRRDGLTSFVEVTQITDEGEDGLALRLRHLHGKLEVPGSEKDLTLLRMREIGERTVEFTDPDGSSGMASMRYTLLENGQLEQRVEFTEESGGKPFTTTYTRDR